MDHMGKVKAAYEASATERLPAAMAVVCGNRQRYAGAMLLQPLLQLLVPVVQHLLNESAAEAVRLPAMHPIVQHRVALVKLTSSRLLGWLETGTAPPAQLIMCLARLPWCGRWFGSHASVICGLWAKQWTFKYTLSARLQKLALQVISCSFAMICLGLLLHYGNFTSPRIQTHR
jgi:hypothetical protein